MSKKVKCAECHYSSCWSLPVGVSESNYEYAKTCLRFAKRTIVCNETMKTKLINHEQYCKKFSKKTEMDLKADSFFQKEILKLENMIKEYEENKEK